MQIDSYQGWAMTQHEAAPGTAKPLDLLFLHGMSAGSWIWSEDWLQRFTRQGYRCWTMTLPGRPHGPTIASDPQAFDRVIRQALDGQRPGDAIDALTAILPGASLLDGPSLDDFSAALEAALASIPGPVAVVGHSLGGAVVQNTLRRGHRPAGAVLMCSVPPYGTWRAGLELAFTNLPFWKALFDMSIFGLTQSNLAVMRQNFFPNGIDDETFGAMIARLTDESLSATSRAQGFPPFAPLPGPRSDVLVMGAGEDRLVPPVDVHLTGLYYGSTPRIIQGSGHMPMIEPLYRDESAGTILDWLTHLPN